eukprot:m51a1_g5732 hypothetical protein (232) ;mRNA; f:1137177-1137872
MMKTRDSDLRLRRVRRKPSAPHRAPAATRPTAPPKPRVSISAVNAIAATALPPPRALPSLFSRGPDAGDADDADGSGSGGCEPRAPPQTARKASATAKRSASVLGASSSFDYVPAGAKASASQDERSGSQGEGSGEKDVFGLMARPRKVHGAIEKAMESRRRASAGAALQACKSKAVVGFVRQTPSISSRKRARDESPDKPRAGVSHSGSGSGGAAQTPRMRRQIASHKSK